LIILLYCELLQMFYLFFTSGLSFFAGIFINYKKIESLFSLFHLLEKKLRYIEHMYHLNDNYQLTNDNQHRMITERVVNIEKILTNSLLEKLKKINNQCKLVDNDDATTATTTNEEPETKTMCDLEPEEYIQDFDDPDAFSNAIVPKKRSGSEQLLEMTKRIIFG